MTKLQENGKRELIDRLALSERRVHQLVGDGIIIESGDGTFDVELNLRRYRAFKDDDVEYVATELMTACEKFTDGIKRLKQEPDLEKRRAMEKRDPVGPQIGRLDRAFRLGNAMSREASRPLLNNYTGRQIGDCFNIYLETLGLTHIGDDEAPRNRRERRRVGR